MSATSLRASPSRPNPTQVANYRLRKQIAHCLPNQNNKCIDYVIIYDRTAEEEELPQFAEDIRKVFFDELLRERFEIEFLDVSDGNQTQVYALLHCPVDRLLQEAETIRLEMRLNTTNLSKVSHLESQWPYSSVF